jgi:hypothetical protein
MTSRAKLLFFCLILAAIGAAYSLWSRRQPAPIAVSAPAVPTAPPVVAAQSTVTTPPVPPAAPANPAAVAATERMYLAHASLRTPEVADPDSASNRQILQTMVTKALVRAASETAHPADTRPLSP